MLRECPCRSLLDPDVADTAPSDSILTTYDEEHLITYLHLLDAVLDHEKSAAPSASDQVQ